MHNKILSNYSVVTAGLPPTITKKHFLTIKKFSLIVQDDYSGHESTKISDGP